MRLFPLLFPVVFFSVLAAWAQSIADPCFRSIAKPGRISVTSDIRNICNCYPDSLSSDLIEWDGTAWLGALNPGISLPPPAGCNVRGIWMGYRGWTPGGEGVALRLDKPLQPGYTYSYTFTYAKDGRNLAEPGYDFSPLVSTDIGDPQFDKAVLVGRLPPVVDWTTNTLTFTASQQQAGHTWLILHTLESSGTILSGCREEDAIKQYSLFDDSSFCVGDTLTLNALISTRYTYHWSTGETTSSIQVTEPGHYSVEINGLTCLVEGSVTLDFDDCSPQLLMPNVFTPNGDLFNEVLKPIQYDRIRSAQIVIYNRWGQSIFQGDVLQGWDGNSNSGSASSGVYYYQIILMDIREKKHSVKGGLLLMR